MLALLGSLIPNMSPMLLWSRFGAGDETRVLCPPGSADVEPLTTISGLNWSMI